MNYYHIWDRIRAGSGRELASELVDYYRRNIRFVQQLGKAFSFEALFVYQPIGLLEEKHPFIRRAFHSTAVAKIYRLLDEQVRSWIQSGELAMTDCSRAKASRDLPRASVDSAHYSPWGNQLLARCILQQLGQEKTDEKPYLEAVLWPLRLIEMTAILGISAFYHDSVAALVVDGQIVAAEPRNGRMQSDLNLKIKFRESFRPFAPAALAGEAGDYLELDGHHDSPYMLMVGPVLAYRRLDVPGNIKELTGLETLKLVRSDVPAVTHVDYSARVQTVDERHGRFHRLLQAFERKTGCGVLINTSFNLRGEPLVCAPEQADHCFMATGIDVLVGGNYLLRKEEQPFASKPDRVAYLAAFETD